MIARKYKSGLVLALLMMAAVILAACSSSEPTNSPSAPASQSSPASTESASESPAPELEATVEFWHAFGEGEEKVLLEEVLPKFNAEYPKITIKATRMPTENLDQQVLTAAAGGVVPDVMRMDNTWVTRMAKEDVLQPVDGFLGFEEIQAAAFEGPMSTNFYNGKYYGVPLDTNTKIAVYNKALLAEAGATAPPETIDELVELARTLKQKGDKFGITIGGPDAWNMPPWFWTLGGQITDDKFSVASGYLNSDASVKALETIVSWNDEGLLAPPILGGQPGTWEGLRGEEGMEASYMMINEGPWFFSILGEEVRETMIPAKMPNGPDGKSHSVIGGQDMVIFADAKEPEAAWIFTKFMLTDEIQKLMAVKTGAIPVIKSAANAPELSETYYLGAYVQEMETAYARTPSANWNQISDVFGKAFESALRKDKSPKEALDAAAVEIDKLLQL